VESWLARYRTRTICVSWRGQSRFINPPHCNSRRNASKLHMHSIYKWNATVRIMRSTHSRNHHSIHRRSTCGSYAWNACTKAECTSLKFVKGAACDLYSKVHRFRAFTGIYFYASAIKRGDKKQMNRVGEAQRLSASSLCFVRWKKFYISR